MKAFWLFDISQSISQGSRLTRVTWQPELQLWEFEKTASEASMSWAWILAINESRDLDWSN